MLDTTGDPAAPTAPAPTTAPGAPAGPLGLRIGSRLAWFLTAFGVWSWIIWITFEKNLIKDASGLAFDDGRATGYFYIHTALAIVSFLLGTAIGVIGIRALRVLRRRAA